jgi:hypothetical protein
MQYLVVARNRFETVAMTATTFRRAEEIRDGFIEDSERRTQRASDHSAGMAVAVAADVVILSCPEGGTLYREG